MNRPLLPTLASLLFVSLAGCYGSIEAEEFDGAELAAPEAIEVLDGLSVVRPDEGMSVAVEVIYEDGNTELVTVRTSDEGEVSIAHHDDFGLQAPPQEGSSKCSDGSYSLMGYKWKQTYEWYYRDANRPGSVGKTGAIKAFKHGFGGVASSRNSCNMNDQVSAKHAYRGTTSTAPNVTYSGCGQPDGKSVVGWGSLPSGTLGLTCTWFIGGEAVESDQRYNKNKSWYAGNSVPKNCSNRRSLRAVATHEAGHTFGLGHSGGKQTMATSISACKSGSRKFGRGDVLGLRKVY